MLQQALLIGIMMMWDDTMMQQWMELKGELLIYNIFSPTLYICAYNFFFFDIMVFLGWTEEMFMLCLVKIY